MAKTIGVVMIVKNEEALLARCLESVKGADEIVICDTGSTDRTIEIARQFTDKVYTDFVWCDDFAKARNHAKSTCTTDWILSIDADETLHSMVQVRDVIEKAWMAVNCTLVAEDNGQAHPFPRIFKNSPEIHWVGAVHNHIDILGEDFFKGWLNPNETGFGDVRITYGYSPAHFLDRNRSLRILEKEAQKSDGVRARFYLGREYWYRRQYDQSVVMLGRYVQESRYLAEKADAFLLMGRSYWAMKMPDDARDATVQALIINPNFKEAVQFMAVIAGEGTGNPRWEANAAQWLHMAETATNEDVLFVRNEETVAISKPAIDPARISACLITKDAVYPAAILNAITKIGFGEISILTNCDSPHRKQELFQKAKHEFIYYQDDDCLAPIAQLLEQAEEDKVVCAMKEGHIKQYANSRIALLGWGAVFPKSLITALDLYRAKWGEDALYRRETERIMTYLSFPQKRLALPIIDLPSAHATDRLSNQPGHYDYIAQVEERCRQLIGEDKSKSRRLLLSPHDDDQALFAAGICIREKPLVVICTDSYIQPGRGEVGCSADARSRETIRACEVLGCDVQRLGIPDDQLTEALLLEKLSLYDGDFVYAPAVQGGNPHHDMVGLAAQKVFGEKVKQYATYSKGQLYTTGTIEVCLTDAEMEKKQKALAAYESQQQINKPHFEAVFGKNEWLFGGRCLHLGCGADILDGWINMDRMPNPNGTSAIYVQADILSGIPLPSDDLDFVLTRDFLEHLPAEARVPVMNQIWRVLKPGGVMEHWVPNAGSRNAYGSPSHLSFWNLQTFEHFDGDSYRWAKDRAHEGFVGKFEKITAELVNWQNEEDGVKRAQSIHVMYRAVK